MTLIYYRLGAWILASITIVVQSYLWFRSQGKEIPTGLLVYLLAACVFGTLGLIVI